MTKNTDETILEPFQSILKFSGNKEFKNYWADVKLKWIQIKWNVSFTTEFSVSGVFLKCHLCLVKNIYLLFFFFAILVIFSTRAFIWMSPKTQACFEQQSSPKKTWSDFDKFRNRLERFYLGNRNALSKREKSKFSCLTNPNCLR